MVSTAQILGLVTPTEVMVSGAVIVVAAVATRLAYLVMTWTIGRVAAKRLAGESTRWRWRTRLTRPAEADPALSEIRRRYRIDAAALALSRLATVVIWSTATVVLLHVHGISVTVAVGSAGFVGFLLALGAQTSVSDYVTGIHVLLEDRFGEGDEIELVTANGRELRGVVTAHGMFGTRIHAEGATHHIANRHMSDVTNHSQLGVITTLDIDHEVDHTTAAVATRRAVASRPEMPPVVVEGVEPVPDGSHDRPPRSRIRLRAARHLGETDQHHFGEQLRTLLEPEDRS